MVCAGIIGVAMAPRIEDDVVKLVVFIICVAGLLLATFHRVPRDEFWISRSPENGETSPLYLLVPGWYFLPTVLDCVKHDFLRVQREQVPVLVDIVIRFTNGANFHVMQRLVVWVEFAPGATAQAAAFVRCFEGQLRGENGLASLRGGAIAEVLHRELESLMLLAAGFVSVDQAPVAIRTAYRKMMDNASTETGLCIRELKDPQITLLREEA